MDNHETQAKLGTQDTEQQRQSWDTDNIEHRTDFVSNKDDCQDITELLLWH
jgi:hypothetical protein